MLTQARENAKLMGTGWEGCDNEEDAITGILLKDIDPARIARSATQNGPQIRSGQHRVLKNRV